MDQATPDEKIPVWVWFTDIDKSNVEAMVEKQTGLNRNNLSVNTDASTGNLVTALELASADNSKLVRANVSNEMELYLEATKEARNIERERTDIYLRTKRIISKELYETNNNKFIDELDIQSKDIFFKSSLTPSVIVYITRDEIINIAKSTSVEDIDFYDETVYDEPITVNRQKDTMQFDVLYKQFGLTGKGVAVLQYERTYVNICEAFFNSIPKPGNITVVRDTKDYEPDDEDYFSSLVTDTTSGNPEHANRMAKVLQDFSENITIFSVADAKFSDIEWVLLTKDIAVITA